LFLKDLKRLSIKGTVHPMKNISSFTDPQVVPNLYLFICFSCWTQKEMFWWSDGWWELL